MIIIIVFGVSSEEFGVSVLYEEQDEALRWFQRPVLDGYLNRSVINIGGYTGMQEKQDLCCPVFYSGTLKDSELQAPL
jgi:hypothetical protein